MKYFYVVILSYMVSGTSYAEVADRVVLAFGMGSSYPVSVDGRPSLDAGTQPEFHGAGTPVTSQNGWNSGVHIGGSLGYLLDKRQKFIVSSSFDYTNYHKHIIEGDIVRALSLIHI